MTVTPMSVENRLIQLSKEIDIATQELVAAEHRYYQAKGAYEVAIAKARLEIGKRYAERGERGTVQEREDEATMRTQEEMLALYEATAVQKAARANAERLEQQIGITRSVGTLVRSSMEALT